MADQATILAEATGLSVEQAAALLQAQEALQAGVPVGVVMRNAAGDTAVRVLSGPGGVPVWSIVSAESPWSIEHRPPELPDGEWTELKAGA